VKNKDINNKSISIQEENDTNKNISKFITKRYKDIYNVQIKYYKRKFKNWNFNR